MRTSITALLAIPVLTAGCAVTTPPVASVLVNGPGLQKFSSCDQLLEYYQEQALDVVGPYGLGTLGADEAVSMESADAAGTAASGASDGTAVPGSDYSTTNTQEVGVDEADIVKTDGSVIVTSLNGPVQIVDVATERVLGQVALPGGQASSELLLHGSTLIVLSTQWGASSPVAEDAASFPAFQPARTVVTRVDISDPAAPVTLGSIRVEGSYRSARMIEDSVRLVMVSEPTGLLFRHPKNSSLDAEDAALAANRESIRTSTIDDWVPHLQVTDGGGARGETQPLMECADISRPREASGWSTLSVLTFDVSGDGVAPTSSTGLVASGDTVYASTDRLVVATSPWDVWQFTGTPMPGRSAELTTDLHTFDISDPGSTTYRASGTVKGHLVNQFALDESDGVLRVATTTGTMGRGAEQASSSLIVLTEDGDELTETGRVDGMGLTEQIYSVRYLDEDLAAIVTFRQTDPLYLVDTSDPSAPRVAGELKIPGYSAYLHPMGDDLLLGVGQDADPETGQTKGLQVSLFDIGDLGSPTRVDQLTWPDTHSAVEWDHRAFLAWEPTGQVLLPAESWSEEKASSGLLSLAVADRRLIEGPRASTKVDGAGWEEPLQRSVVIGDDVWALGFSGLYRYDLASLNGGLAVRLP